ncbi:NAC domain-containing protein 83-like [Syzygium oleosum]|uniref:NAC domain-containing protein 83-like n=1 Tax=Syzygium oleosum TaxID=219896 RepID=UPI0024BAF75A|nr:NAC domain-containing protein 83-like [Syzygium oleosum]
MEDTISEVVNLLPPGFRFHATDEELLILYLKPKILGQPDELYYNIIQEIDLCKYEPWDLPGIAGHMFNSKELFFYCCMKRKYLNSKRSNRTTVAGYWKVTGKERRIMSENTNEQIGIKKTLVFYKGRVPDGKRTNWVMHEYHLKSKCLGDNHEEGEMLPYVACRIKYKKDKKTTMDHALTIGPEGYLSSPYTCTSDVSNPPVNQEGDLPSYCNTLNNEVADHQVAADAQPQTSLEEIMNSLSPLETLDDCISNYINTPTYQPQAGADEGPSSFFDFSDDNSMQELSKLFRSG